MSRKNQRAVAYHGLRQRWARPDFALPFAQELFMSTHLLRWPILAALVFGVALSGCASEQQVLALKKRVDALEKQNAELQRRLDAVDKGGGGGGPLGQLGGLVGLIGQLAKNAKPAHPGARRAPYGSPTQMDPALQARLDKLVVDSLEKLAKSDDAKSLVKTMLRAMRRDVEAPQPSGQAGQGGRAGQPRVGRGGAGSLPLPIPPAPKPKQKKTQP